MRKYLINGAMALIVGGFLASCTHDDVGAPATVNDRTKSFDEMFTELYGPIAPNHNWGFATVGVSEEANDLTEDPMLTRAMTRTADTNSNEWTAKGYNVPGEITAREREVVMQWFRTHENPQSETVDTHNYFIQNVGYTDHTYNAYYQKDGRTETVTITNPGTNNMDYIFVGPGYYLNYGMTEPARITSDNGDDHVNNFNAGSGQIQHIMYSGSEYFGFHDSYGTGSSTAGHGNNGKYCEKNRNFVIRFIDVDGVVGCYVGFNYESGKTSEGWHLDPDGFFDDRVIKLVAANPNAYSKTISIQKKIHKKIIDQGRVFCEDIATAHRQVKEDIDYNDIVFDARVWEIYDQYEVKNNETTTPSAKTNWRYQYDICLLATGGTIAEKVGIDEKEVDVHDAFGVGQAFMVNTWTPNCPSTLSGQWNTPNHIINAVDFSYTIKKSEQNNPNTVGISTIPITVKYDGTNGGVKALNNRVTEDGTDADGKAIKKSSAPYKLCVPLGTPWPIERANIKSAYKNFSSYVSGEQAFWTDNIEQNNLYTSAPPSSIHNDKKAIGYTEDVNDGNPTSSTVMVVWDKPVSKQKTKTLRLYNFNFVAGQTLRFYGTGSFKVQDNNNQELFSVVFVGGSNDITINNYQAGMLKESITITSSSDFTLTEIVALDKFEIK